MADNKNIPQPILKPEIENKYHHYGVILVKMVDFGQKYGHFGQK